MGVCACLLAVVGSSRAVAQQQPPAVLPPVGSVAPDVRPAIPGLPSSGAARQPVAVQPGGNGQPGAGDVTKVPTLPPPRPLVQFGPGHTRVRVPGVPGIVGATPVPTPETLKDIGQYVGEKTTPVATLDLISGGVQVIKLKDVPKRIQVADESVAAYTLITPTELSLSGRNVGSTVLNLWFADAQDKTKEKIISYLVRVTPDGAYKENLIRVYKQLEVEINTAFPDSRVSLMLCGEKLLVCGMAKDICEANNILEIVRSQAPTTFVRETTGEQAARIPLDRARHETDPRNIPPEGTPPGTEDYLVSAGPQVVNLLRVTGEQQVMLQVTVAEVNRAAARAIGLNFNIFNNRGGQVIASNVGGIVPVIGNQSFAQFIPTTQTVTGISRSALGNLPVALDNGQIQLAISALRELHYSRTLAEPALTAMNGQTANFQVGGLFPVPYLTGFTAAGLQGVGFIPTGVQLSFTPYITDRDRIRLQVSAEVSERDLTLGSTIIQGSAVPSLITRNFQTTVELREGQTLAVAGLVQNRLAANASRVPGLGDIPIIGRAFAFDRINADEQELVILITPELVHPMEPKHLGPLPGSDIFEPGDMEFYLLGRLESRRSYDFRSPVMTDLNRIARYRHCEQIYITGSHGHCGSAYHGNIEAGLER